MLFMASVRFIRKKFEISSCIHISVYLIFDATAVNNLNFNVSPV